MIRGKGSNPRISNVNQPHDPGGGGGGGGRGISPFLRKTRGMMYVGN